MTSFINDEIYHSFFCIFFNYKSVVDKLLEKWLQNEKAFCNYYVTNICVYFSTMTMG